MSIPRVVVRLNKHDLQKVRSVTVFDYEIPCESVQVTRVVGEITRITLTIPGEYIEEYDE